MPRNCNICKKWDEDRRICKLTNEHKDKGDWCSSFDSIPCCNCCEYWEFDYDDFTRGYCSVHRGGSPYDAICKTGDFKPK